MNKILVLILAIIYLSKSFPLAEDFQLAINQLYGKLEKNYWRSDQNFSTLPAHWERKKGLYSSKVHMNFVDKRNSKMGQKIRENGIDDSNMFVTNFILFGLLEAQQMGGIKINEHSFSQSLMAISSFHDKNTLDGVPVYNFWTQTNINGTWVATPNNLLNLVSVTPNFTPLESAILDKLGLGLIVSAKSIAQAFVIPPDNDDSSVNLALLSLMKETNSSHHQFFASLNTKKKQYYDTALKYAYRPFGADKTRNKHGDEIDARSYYVLHSFLQKKKEEMENPQLILPTTWLINLDEQIKSKIAMPFNCNNVDVTVATNFLFGLSSQILIQGFAPSLELQKMALDTSELIQYAIKEMIEKRPSLLLVYYPSKFDFYWFVARLTNLLKRYEGKLTLALQEIKQRIQAVMKNQGSQQILAAAHQEKEEAYWCEFLGNFGKKERKEDAYFSTSMAVNALIDTWTRRSKGSISFDEQTPESVKEIIKKGLNFLLSNTKSKNHEMNAFFSGSVKSFNTLPFIYPTNVNYSPKNPNINPNTDDFSQISSDTVSFMKGYIQKDAYQQMLGKKWYGFSVPLDEGSFNDGFGLLFPFWSAESFTQIMGINALVKGQKLFTQSQGKNLKKE